MLPRSIRTAEVNGNLRGPAEEKCSRILTLTHPLRIFGALMGWTKLVGQVHGPRRAYEQFLEKLSPYNWRVSKMLRLGAT